MGLKVFRGGFWGLRGDFRLKGLLNGENLV